MAAGSANTTGETGIRVGPLQMRPDVTWRHLGTLFFVSFFGIAVMNTVGLLQPYVLREILHIPENEQGALTGHLLTLQEFINLAMVAVAGTLSDRTGRRPVFATGLLLLALGYCLYPLATDRFELALFRVSLALGVACINAMLTTVANDYTVEKSRARMIAAVFIFNGIGIATLPRLIGGLPQAFIHRGYDPAVAGRLTYWCVAGLCLFLSAVIVWGLQPGAPAQVSRREHWLTTARVGIGAARNPRIALAYAAGVVSRADLAVVSTFLSLWLVSEGVSQGLTTAESLKRATLFYVIIQAMAVPWAPIFGWILDRIDRVVGLMGAMVIAGVGYFSLSLLRDPLGAGMYASAVLVGMGEMAANIAATSLIGKEAPDRGRGAIIGVYSFFGALGILIVAQVGGYLFDRGYKVGPFVFMAGANALLLLLAAAVFVLARRPAGVATADASTHD